MRNVFKLPISHADASKLFRHRPRHGTIVAAEYRYSDKGAVVAQKNQILSNSGWIRYENYKCRATDLLGFLKYGKWVRYDPIDGNWSNLRWSNLRRVRAPSRPKPTPEES